MNKTALVLGAGLVFGPGGISQAHSQAATEYGLAAVASHRMNDHSAASARIYRSNATDFARKSSASSSTAKKSSGRTAGARAVHRGATQQAGVANSARSAQDSAGLQMTIVGAAHQ